MTRFGNAMRSVRGRITLIATALVAVTLTVASLLLMQLVQADLLASAEETLDVALAAQAEELEAALDEAVGGFDESFDLIEADIDGSAVEIGVFIESEDGLALGELFVDGEQAAGLILDPDSGEIVEILDVFTGRPLSDAELREDIESMVFEVFEVAGADADGARFLVGATPLAEIEESIDAIREALLVIVPALVVLFALSTWWLAGRALRPVMSITEQVEAISAASLDRRVPVPETGDEVAELATVMNRMLDRLERGGERQRQFSADASHELRSPLSTVRAAAEVLGRNPPPDRVARLAEDIAVESERMERLITDLLELSRLDEDRRAAGFEELDLVWLVRAELDGRHVELEAPSQLTMTGSPSQLRRMVRNLVDNGVRHADDRVLVSLGVANGEVVLTVDDDGEGVPEAERATVFERFSRLDHARSRDGGGYGLGLALVRAIADRHGGSVEVDTSALGGARFRVTLPSAASKA